MSSDSTLSQILDEWRASLSSDKLKTKNVEDNFAELFEKWQEVGATRDQLYESWLRKAIDIHLPTKSVAKNAYHRTQFLQKQSLDEFFLTWKKDIERKAMEVFFEIFPLDTEESKKTYGNLGKAEYMHQRRLAAQFPILDTTELEKRLYEKNYDLDIEDLQRALQSGFKKEDNSDV